MAWTSLAQRVSAKSMREVERAYSMAMSFLLLLPPALRRPRSFFKLLPYAKAVSKGSMKACTTRLAQWGRQRAKVTLNPRLLSSSTAAGLTLALSAHTYHTSSLLMLYSLHRASIWSAIDSPVSWPSKIWTSSSTSNSHSRLLAHTTITLRP